MQYGSSKWQQWVLDDQEVVNQHVKYAYEAGIQTFDTANVRATSYVLCWGDCAF